MKETATNSDSALAGGAATNSSAVNSRYSLSSHEKKSSKRTTVLVAVIIAIIVVLAAAAGGYYAWDTLREPDIASYQDVEIKVVGLENGPSTLTAADIAAMDCERISATNTSDKAGQGQTVEKTAVGWGVLLDDWLAQYGYQLTDFKRIVFHCKDSYETAVLPSTTLEGPVYISIAKGKDALPDAMTPARLIMPDMAPGQWVYGIDTITFEAA